MSFSSKQFKVFVSFLPDGILCVFVAELSNMPVKIHVNSPNVKYTDTHIEAQYSYHTTSVHKNGNTVTVSLALKCNPGRIECPFHTC